MKDSTSIFQTDGNYLPPFKDWIPFAILIWIGTSLFNAGIFIFSFEDGEPVYNFFYGFKWTPLYHSPWLLITPCILFLARKFPLMGKITVKNLSIHLIFALILTFISSLGHTYFIYLRLGEPFQFSSLIENFLFYSVDRLMIYFVIIVGYYVIEFYRKQSNESLRELKLRQKISKQKLNSFKNNIQPEFLLNTLKDIEMFILTNPGLAEQLIADLAQGIRRMLQNSQKEIISIKDDLRFIKCYISILGKRIDKIIHLKEAINDEEMDRELSASLFAISIFEELLDFDKHMFQSLDNVVYEPNRATDYSEIKIQLEKLLPSTPASAKWLSNGKLDELANSVTSNMEGSGKATLEFSDTGILFCTFKFQS